MDELNVRGEWWLPGSPERRIPGVFTFDQDHGGRLSLNGALSRIEDHAESVTNNGVTTTTVTVDALEASGRFDRILGEAEGKAYTLDQSFTIHRTGLFATKSLETIYVNRAYVGVWYEPSEVTGGDRIRIQMAWLTHFVNRSGIERPIPTPGQHENPEFLVVGKSIDPEVVTLHDGSELRLIHNMGQKTSITEMSITQRFDFAVHHDNIRPADELIEIASDLQDLVSMGVGRHCTFEKISLFHPDLAHEINSRRIEEPILVLARSNAEPADEKQLKSSDIFFTLDDIGGVKGVAKWMEVSAKHRETMGRVMATRYARDMYVSDRYLNRVAALEGFNRVEAGDANQNVSLNRRLTRCITLAGEPMRNLVGDTDNWVRILKRDRDDIAHHYGRRRREESAEQHELAESAYWLYVFCMLRLIDTPPATFKKIMGHQQILHLQRKLASVQSKA